MSKTPEQCADWALEAVKSYAARVGSLEEDVDVQIIDLLADVMHLCEREELDLNQLVERAEFHYEEER